MCPGPPRKLPFMSDPDPSLVELLACPQPHHSPVVADGDELVCTECGARYPVRDGIPIMLIDEAAPARPASGSAPEAD